MSPSQGEGQTCHASPIADLLPLLEASDVWLPQPGGKAGGAKGCSVAGWLHFFGRRSQVSCCCHGRFKVLGQAGELQATP